MSRAHVDRRHIAYRPPFHVEAFMSGLVIGCDAGGMNCIRFEGAAPGHFGCVDPDLMGRAVAALNNQPLSEFMSAELEP